MNRFPTLFLSHGSPLHALDAGGAGRAWRAIADSLPKPRTILMVSAHWETSLPMLTGGAQLKTIHDFGGFPEPLYRLRYDAPGAPGLGTAHHLQVGRALQSLTGRGVLVIGSGHVTHNLRDWMTSRAALQPLPYVAAFSQWLENSLARDDEEALLAYREQAPEAARAHPTEEHFLPLYVALGAAGAGAKSTRVYQGMEGAALSMDAYEFRQAA